MFGGGRSTFEIAFRINFPISAPSAKAFLILDRTDEQLVFFLLGKRAAMGFCGSWWAQNSVGVLDQNRRVPIPGVGNVIGGQSFRDDRRLGAGGGAASLKRSSILISE